MSRSYKHIRRDNARQYPHQVHLPHARLWRMDHVDAQPGAGSGVAGLVNALRH
jgi:hypothetical protein